MDVLEPKYYAAIGMVMTLIAVIGTLHNIV